MIEITVKSYDIDGNQNGTNSAYAERAGDTLIIANGYLPSIYDASTVSIDGVEHTIIGVTKGDDGTKYVVIE